MTRRAPRTSVIIAAYYSDATVADCLESLRRQSFRDFEVIVVTSSPEERTGRVVTERFPEVRFEQAPKRLLPHAARNRGVELARGDVLVFTDPDCVARPDWLAGLVAAHDAGHPIVCGSIDLASGGWVARGVHLSKYSFRLSALRAGPTRIVGTANACYSREVWQAVGPFAGDRMAGDALLGWRAAAHGFQPWFEPSAVVDHHRFEGTAGSVWTERVERGADFAEVRAQFQAWSRLRTAAYLAAFPVLPLMALARDGRDAFLTGWGRAFLLTVPVQLFAHLAWCLGEARARVRLLFRGTPRPV
jgi:GT2 family glycosyltransferase